MEERAKRKAPAPVKPVEIGGVRCEVASRARAQALGQPCGVVVAFDAATGTELWALAVYRTEFDPAEERDVQEVHITALRTGHGRGALIVENEAGKTFSIDLRTREVVEQGRS